MTPLQIELLGSTSLSSPQQEVISRFASTVQSHAPKAGHPMHVLRISASQNKPGEIFSIDKEPDGRAVLYTNLKALSDYNGVDLEGLIGHEVFHLLHSHTDRVTRMKNTYRMLGSLQKLQEIIAPLPPDAQEREIKKNFGSVSRCQTLLESVEQSIEPVFYHLQRIKTQTPVTPEAFARHLETNSDMHKRVLSVYEELPTNDYSARTMQDFIRVPKNGHGVRSSKIDMPVQVPLATMRRIISMMKQMDLDTFTSADIMGTEYAADVHGRTHASDPASMANFLIAANRLSMNKIWEDEKESTHPSPKRRVMRLNHLSATGSAPEDQALRAENFTGQYLARKFSKQETAR